MAGEIADGVARRKLGPADALRLAAEASEIAERLSQGGKLDHAWAAALRTAEQAGSVAAYCDSAALGTTPGEAEATDAVQVMTLHRAKGLEFDHVLLAGLEEGVWPNWQAEQQGAIAEERRAVLRRRDPRPALAAAELGAAPARLGRQAVALPGGDPEGADRGCRGGTAIH